MDFLIDLQPALLLAAANFFPGGLHWAFVCILDEFECTYYALQKVKICRFDCKTVVKMHNVVHPAAPIFLYSTQPETQHWRGFCDGQPIKQKMFALLDCSNSLNRCALWPVPPWTTLRPVDGGDNAAR